MSAFALYEQAVDSVKDAGSRFPTDGAATLVSSVEWPDDLADRAVDGLTVGLDAVKHTVVPAASAVADAGAVATGSTTRWVRRHPIATAAGLAAVIAALVWATRRRRTDQSPADAPESAGLAA